MDLSNQSTTIVSIRLPNNLRKVIQRMSRVDNISFTDTIITMCNFTIETGCCDDCRKVLLDLSSDDYLTKFGNCKKSKTSK